MLSFFNLGVKEHLGNDNKLVKLSKLIDWSKFVPLLKDIHKEDGRPGYDPLKMLKGYYSKSVIKRI